MLVAELVGQREFRLVEQAVEPPGPGEVQVRVGAVGICGSDVHSYSEGGIGDTPCIYPMVLGHEPAGTVVKIGDGVTGWSAGDRAALEPAIYCYHCEFCRSGRHNICANIKFLSNAGYPGFFREFVNLPATNVLAIPPEMSLELATVAEPLAVALHSLQFAGLTGGESVAVFGAGPIGLLTIASLKAGGAGRIWAVEPVAHRRDMALAMGADVAIDPTQVDPSKEIVNVDVAIDCAAKQHTHNWAFRVLKNGGRMLLTGIHSEAVVGFEVSHMRRKEIAIFNVRRSNHETHDALEFLKARPELFAPMITHRRPLRDIVAAFELVENYADGVGKLVVV